MKKVTKWILILTVGMGWLVVLPKVHAQNPTPTPTKEIGFTVTDPNLINEVGRDKTYDYEPSVLIENNGDRKVYVCGGGVPPQPGVQPDPLYGHDAIYLTEFNSSGVKIIDSKMVMAPMLNSTADDGVHDCNPTVIKQTFNWTGTTQEKYLMYYECAPKVLQKSDNGEVDAFTQICVAFSDDGINWGKYNENIFSSQYRFANANEPATAVVKLNPEMVSNFGIYKNDQGTYVMSSGTTDINAYGVGHPSALVKDGKIWLYYYDSVGDWGSRGVFLAKSDDGFHFYPTVVKITDLVSSAVIKYVAVPTEGKNGFFVMLGSGFSVLYYNYSWDGITWAWPEPAWSDSAGSFYKNFLANNYSIGSVTTGNCVSPGGNTLTADKFGWLHSLDAEIWINEGKMGSADGCSVTKGCTCYSAYEESPQGGRGYTWQTYMYKGKFLPMPTLTPTPTPILGDLNHDGKVDTKDYNLFIANFGKTGSSGFIPADINGDGKVDIFDYNILVGNFGK